MVFIGFIAVLIVVFSSLFGWGTLANRLTRSPVRNAALIVMVGLGVVVFLGGVLNLLRLAYGWAFDGLILGGIALAVSLNRNFRPSLPKNKGEWLYVLVLGLVISLIMGITIETQLPPRAFNFHDDFEKYFAYPVRMLETGTLFGSPLSAIGLETLGGTAVLHGIILNHFPISYINGTDAVFGLFLCLILPVSMVPRRLKYLPISLLGLLIVFFINPQYVNVSALYLGSAFMMASILLLSQTYENGNEESNYLPPPIFISLIYAALFAMKTNLPVFPAIQGVLFCVAMVLSGVSVRRLARWSLSTVFLTLLFLSPWILLHLPHYLHWSPVPVLYEVPATYEEKLNLFSFSPLFYGGSFALYTFLALAAGLPIAALSFWKLKGLVLQKNANLAGIVASGASITIAYLFIVGMGPRINSYDVNLRYTIPFLIAGAPTITILSGLWMLKQNVGRFRFFFVTVLIVFQLLIIAGFSENLISRMQEAIQSGNILAFPRLTTTQRYLEYNDEVLHGNTRFRIAEVQKKVPVGQAFVAWIYTPFYFDYKRNVIFDVDFSGLGNPWAYIPGAEYFIIEYAGFAVRPVSKYYEDLQDPGRKQSAEIGLNFLRNIQELSQNADVLYNDGGIVVFKIKKKS
jgi:hypothetical protein